MNILKHVIDQEIHVKVEFFKCEMNSQEQNITTITSFKILKTKNIDIKKFSMHFTDNFFI